MSKRSKYLATLASKVAVSSSLLTAISAAMAAPLSDKLQLATALNPTEAIIKEVVEARKKFGFKHDRAYVRELLTRPDSFGAVVGPLTGNHYATPEEVKELKVRLEVQSDATSMMSRAREDKDFAGMYVDKKGTLHIGFTKSSKEKVLGFQKNAKHPKRVRVFKANNSLTALEMQKQRIVESSTELVADGVQISQVAIDIKTNLVKVSVVNLDAGKRDAITSRFGQV
ncbi:MAG: hypothetical protein GY954_08850, partial [Alteromonas sp.]|nr:hypothetical protein [Alteromonas sp.]